MDFGLYNKVPQQAGRHGTLVGLWYEEAALDAPLDRTRPRYTNTFARVIACYDNRDSVKKETIHQTSYTYDRTAAIEAQKLNRAMTIRDEMLATIQLEAEQKQRKAYETSYQCTIGMPKQLAQSSKGNSENSQTGAVQNGNAQKAVGGTTSSSTSAASSGQENDNMDDIEIPY